MLKKIDAQNISKGMYVTRLDRPWRESPFLFQGFEITSDEEIKQLHKLCRHVYIDTDQGLDLTSTTSPSSKPPTATPQAEPKTKTHAKPTRYSGQRPVYHDKTSLEQELRDAIEAEEVSRETIWEIMHDVRMGKSIDCRSAKRAVEAMAGSVIRNPDAMVCLSQLKDKHEYTALHSLRVCILALAFGRHLGYAAEELHTLGLGALLHDVGKMRVPVDILNKPEKLSPAEAREMKRHVEYGVQILQQTKGIPDTAIEVARYHHERYDGRGYAMNLMGDKIPQYGLIGAIVDCYDAITSDRVYHNGISAHTALQKMYDWRNTAFDAQLVEQFIQCMGIYPIGSLVEMNTGSIGVVATINRSRRLKPKVVLILTPDKQRYTQPKMIDLLEQGNDTNAGLEIKKVIRAGTHDINPADYLPTQAKPAVTLQ